MSRLRNCPICGSSSIGTLAKFVKDTQTVRAVTTCHGRKQTGTRKVKGFDGSRRAVFGPECGAHTPETFVSLDPRYARQVDEAEKNYQDALFSGGELVGTDTPEKAKRRANIEHLERMKTAAINAEWMAEQDLLGLATEQSRNTWEIGDVYEKTVEEKTKKKGDRKRAEFADGDY